MLIASQPGATVAPRYLVAGLGEALEDLFLLLGGNADTVVGHAEAQTLAGVAGLQHSDLQQHLALLGELQRIGQQVTQHLAQELLGAPATVLYLGFDTQAQASAVVIGAWLQQGHHVVQQAPQGEVHRLRLAGAVLQLGEVQHLVEDRQQSFACCG